jgi:hypothetical protein
MRGVAVYTDPRDVIHIRTASHTGDYVVTIGEASIYLPPSTAAELRDALTAALADHEETPNGH